MIDGVPKFVLIVSHSCIESSKWTDLFIQYPNTRKPLMPKNSRMGRSKNCSLNRLCSLTHENFSYERLKMSCRKLQYILRVDCIECFRKPVPYSTEKGGHIPSLGRLSPSQCRYISRSLSTTVPP